MYLHDSSPSITSSLQEIPEGKAGIVITLKAMRRMVKNSKTSMPVRNTALSLIQGLKPKDWLGEIKALHAFVRDNIRYVRDIKDVETVQTPDITLRLKAGDCDDKSVLLASLLESIGHPTAFVAVGFSPDDYSHVLVESRIGNKWLPLETTENVAVGWYPPNVKSRLVIFN